MSISVLDIEPEASGIALATTLYTALLVTLVLHDYMQQGF